jgi:hypothetical protein
VLFGSVIVLGYNPDAKFSTSGEGSNGEFKHFAFAAPDLLVVYSTYNPTCTGFYTADSYRQYFNSMIVYIS